MNTTTTLSTPRVAFGFALLLALGGCARVGLGGDERGPISAADGNYAGASTRGSGTESLCERRYDVRASVKLGEIALELVDPANPTRAPLRTTALADSNGTALTSILIQGRSHVIELRLANGTLRGTVEAPTCRMSLSARRTDAG